MGTVIVELPDELDEFVRQQSEAAGCGSTARYVRELVLRERLRTLLVEGRDSGVGQLADEHYFAALYGILNAPE